MEPINFRIDNTSVKNGQIDHVDIGDATVVDCSNCTSLTELPLWPNVTKVWCNNCPSLTELPLWPNIPNVYSNLLVKFVYTLVDPNKTIYSSQSEKCCICMETPNEIIFDPCYHFATCIKCAEQLNVEWLKRCPICNTKIQSLIKNLWRGSTQSWRSQTKLSLGS